MAFSRGKALAGLVTGSLGSYGFWRMGNADQVQQKSVPDLPQEAPPAEIKSPDSPVYQLVSEAGSLMPMLKYYTLPTNLRNVQAKIRTKLLEANVEELNEVFEKREKVEGLLRVVDDGTLTLLRTMDDGRLRDLNVKSRATIVSACQSGGYLSSARYAELVCGILLETHEQDLSVLKNLLDQGGSFHNLHKLVYLDLKQEARVQVLQHVKEQAQVAKAQNGGRSLGLRIVCDLDDTLYCSNGKNYSGLDTRFPQFNPYPGVLALLDELVSEDKSPTQTSTGEQDVTGRNQTKARGLSGVAFLSARPHAYKDWVEAAIYRYLHSLYTSRRFAVMPTVLPGSLNAMFSAVTRGLAARREENRPPATIWAPIADFKHQRFVEYAALYPEYRFLFIGDNGQGDLSVGERLMRASEATPSPEDVSPSPEVVCALIHEVQPRDRTLSTWRGEPLAEREARWERDKVFFFRTYVGAAVPLAGLGLLSSDGVRRICDEARRDFQEFAKSCPEPLDGQRDYSALLEQDVDLANKLIMHASHT